MPPDHEPTVLVLTPMKNATSFLPRYVELLEALDWPADRLSIGIMEGDSDDGTPAALAELRPRLEQRARRVGLFRETTVFACPTGCPAGTQASS